MKTINRTVIIVSPKAPYLNWLKSLKISNNELNLNLYMNDCGAYLVNEIDNTNDFNKLLERKYKLFFESELSGYVLDQNKWPKNISINLFNEWFNVNYHTVIFDLSKTELKLEEL